MPSTAPGRPALGPRESRSSTTNSAVKIFSAAEVDAALDDLALIDRLETLFRAGCEMPPRHHHTIVQPPGPGSADAMLLLMPAWTRGAWPSPSASRSSPSSQTTASAGLPSIYGQYLLLDGTTGQTDRAARRHHADQAADRLRLRPGLALLVAPRCRQLLMIGTGALAPQLIRVHAKVRPIEEVAIWGRRPDRRRVLPRNFRSLPQALARPIAVRAVADRRQAVGRGRYHLCATLSHAAGRGRLAARGPACRPGGRLHAQDARKRRQRQCGVPASMSTPVPAPSRKAATSSSRWPTARSRDRCDRRPLRAVARRQRAGRTSGDATSITLFKSVGAALEDLAAAELAVTGSISAPSFFRARSRPRSGPASARRFAESPPAAAPCGGWRAAFGLMRMGGSTIMISPSLGCGYFLKSCRHTRCGSSNRSLGRRQAHWGSAPCPGA